jgi:hypothetical protein
LPWRPKRRSTCGIGKAAPFKEAQQRADAGKPAPERACACASGSPMSEEAAQVGRA